MADPPAIPILTLDQAAQDQGAYGQAIRNRMGIDTANGGLVGQAMGRATPFMSQQQPYDQRLADARAQQVGALGYARNQALGLAPSAADIGQQIQLGANANTMGAAAQGGNILAMRNGLAGGFGAAGQAVGEAGKARGEEQGRGMSLYGQGVNALGQSDLAQRQLALDNLYRQQQLAAGQARQNYNLGSGYEGLWSEQNKQIALQNAADQKRWLQQSAQAGAQTDAYINQAAGTGLTAAEGVMAVL